MAKLVALIVSPLLLGVQATEVVACPGESDRYGDHKCNHDETHRVCATLLDGSGKPAAWGSDGKNFWEITGQEAFMWDQEIRDNKGDSWCICMWATAHLISSVGCDNVHLNCAATDVSHVMDSYEDGGVDLKPAKDCLAKKCPALATQTLIDATVPQIESHSNAGVAPFSRATALAGAAVLAVAAVAVMRVWRRPSVSASVVESQMESQIEIE